MQIERLVVDLAQFPDLTQRMDTLLLTTICSAAAADLTQTISRVNEASLQAKPLTSGRVLP